MLRAQSFPVNGCGAACERAPFAAAVLLAVLVPFVCIGFAFPKVANSVRAVFGAPASGYSKGFAVFEGAHLSAATTVLFAQSLGMDRGGASNDSAEPTSTMFGADAL